MTGRAAVPAGPRPASPRRRPSPRRRFPRRRRPPPPAPRRAGVILHPTSLPGPYGTGDLGDAALRFVDWLCDAGMTCWQTLPLVPPERVYWSPYSGEDALCGNTLLINLEQLARDGLVDAGRLPAATVPETDPATGKALPADFDAAAAAKEPVLTEAARTLLSSTGQMNAAFREWR